MPLVRIKALAEFPPGSLEQIAIDGIPYALCNHNGTLRAFGGLCPHAGGPLGDGNLDGGQIVCPWHAWAFDCESGVNDYDPSIELNSYPVVVEAGSIFVRLA
jgi:nitrite reductase (NADH) small subunit